MSIQGVARIAKAREGRPADDPSTSLAEAVLRYRHGEFSTAVERFDVVVPRYPVGEDSAAMAAAAKRYAELVSTELGFRKRDETKNLPRARIVTTKGAAS